ncbi:hypothetical protein F4802DRAFT_252418 [Xylaria palmicola]|nr:hypothetical protein F4802DRAFT_252418 [Xylaria palmicola]
MARRDGPSQCSLELVASTGDIAASHAADPAKSPDDVLSYLESAQWTADGTTLLTHSSTNLVSGYTLPEDLLSAGREHVLSPQAQVQLPEPSIALPAPYYALAAPWTHHLLVSSRDHPIQLRNITLSSTPDEDWSSAVGSYPFTKPHSDAFLAATSLLWPSPGTHFIAGSRSLLARFDARRSGESPVVRVPTIPSERHLSKGGGVGMRGTVSALGAQPTDGGSGAGLVAAGTWTRWVGLYDFAQAGKCVSTWTIAAAVRETAATWTPDVGEGVRGGDPDGIGGNGITQTTWSPCGRYLVICERKSRGALIYDVRVTGRLLGYLTGRDALGNQRISCDVFPGGAGDGGGFEVWSGTSSGMVKIWEHIGTQEGPHAPTWEWAAHQSTVGATCLHPSGSVVATCAGSWEFPDREDDPKQHGSFDGSDQSSSTDCGGDSDDSQSGYETNSSNGSVPWMHRRNKESSLKIWNTAGLT